MGVELQTTFKVFYQHWGEAAYVKTLKAVYGLRAGEAREVLALVGTSQADCVERCVEKAVTKAKRAGYLAREAMEKADAEVARLLPASVAATATRADKLALAAAQRVSDAARAAAKAAVTEIAKAEKRVRAKPAAATAAARAAATGLVHKPSQKELDEVEDEGGEGVPTLREAAKRLRCRRWTRSSCRS